MNSPSGGLRVLRKIYSPGALRAFVLLLLALAAFALVLLIFGKNPIKAYIDIFGNTLGSGYGLSETLVKMIPLILTALAVAVPSRIWLINVGGEGQLYLGALLATWGALTFGSLPTWLLIPLIMVLGFLGGGLWGGLCGYLRARGWVSETISTLLMNYVAILLVSFFVFGPWKDTESANYPQTPEFSETAVLPAFFGTRVHVGLVLALAALALFFFILSFQGLPDFKQLETVIGTFGTTTTNAATDAGLKVDISAPSPVTPSMTMAIDAYLSKCQKKS